MISKFKIAAIACLVMSQMSVSAQMGKCKGKYVGNIIANKEHANYTALWNQTTSENGSKWGSCDRGNGVYNFDNSDFAYNIAKKSGGAFKFHTLIWGAQAPGYLKTSSATDVMNAIKKWYAAVEAHYAPMGGLDFIDVLNEPVNTPIDRELANLKAALTQGYKAEPANAADLNNAYGWAIWPFQLARKHFPNATLLINEFNIEHNWNNCRATYISMANAIKNAPNLTDGKKNLIDGIGLQAHGMNGQLNLSAANYKACIDEIWNKTGLPIHITELDVVADPDETAQKNKLQEFFSIAWEHPHVAGITMWGYIQGATWIPGNGVTGAGGTDSGIQYANLTDRPAMTWLKSYMAAQPSLSCCPDPAPFANCINGAAPKIKIISPLDKAAFSAPASVSIDAEATDTDGTISNIFYYINDVLVQEEWVAPYAFVRPDMAAGTYVIKAVATDDKGNTATSSVTIKVNPAQAPYGGTPRAIPGKIEFEHFDIGGNGFAYADSTAGSQVSPVVNFRTDEDVDIENCTDAGLGYNLGYTNRGEWLEYTVNVAKAGKYDVTFRAACLGDGRTLSLASGTTVLSKDVAIPNTTGWQAWQDVVVKEIQLEAGVQVLRVTIGAVNYINLNYMSFAASAVPVPTVKLTKGWNLIGSPVAGSTDIDKSLASVWKYVESVKDMDTFYRPSQPAMFNTLTKIDWGKGYMINVTQDCDLVW